MVYGAIENVTVLVMFSLFLVSFVHTRLGNL